MYTSLCLNEQNLNYYILLYILNISCKKKLLKIIHRFILNHIPFIWENKRMKEFRIIIIHAHRMCINTILLYCSVCVYEFSLYMKKVLIKDIFEHGINLLLFCYLFKFNIPLSRPTYPDSSFSKIWLKQNFSVLILDMNDV